MSTTARRNKTANTNQSIQHNHLKSLMKKTPPQLSEGGYAPNGMIWFRVGEAVTANTTDDLVMHRPRHSYGSMPALKALWQAIRLEQRRVRILNQHYDGMGAAAEACNLRRAADSCGISPELWKPLLDAAISANAHDRSLEEGLAHE